MATNSLTTRSAGETIQDSYFNDFNTALSGDFVGRNASGVPTAGQNLGTLALPWGTVRTTSLVLNGSTLDPSLITAPTNRVTSGRTRSTSNQPAYIVPNGAALSLVIDGTPTSLVYDVNGTAVTLSADLTKSGLTAAPSTNNTCLVNDTDAADQEDTKLWGEVDGPRDITIDTVGSEISALVGKWAAFSVDNGSTTEMFIAFVESATKLSKAYRAFFYDSTIAPQKRIVFSNNDIITLLKLGWVFIENDAVTVDVTYSNPTIDFQSPGSPATGDYWYDLLNNVWKRYDGAAFVIVNRTLIGMFANSTTACIGARSLDFYATYSNDSTLDIVKSTTEIARAKGAYSSISVAGRKISFGIYMPTWNITTDLAGAADMYSATEQASREYFLYVKDTGETIISDISPYARADLYGKYHPHNPWRCVGSFYNDGSSNMTRVSAGSGGWKKFDMPIIDDGGVPLSKGTVQVDHAEWRELPGGLCQVRWMFHKTTVTGDAGTGNYRFALPHKAEDIYSDTTLRDATPAYATGALVPGIAWLSTTGDVTSSFRSCMINIHDNLRQFFLFAQATSTANIVGSTFGDLNGVSYMQLDFIYPVDGWGE